MFTSSMPNLYSADVAAAAGFYRDVLGFEQTYQFPPAGLPQHVELRLGGSMLALSSHAAVSQHLQEIFVGSVLPRVEAHGRAYFRHVRCRHHKAELLAEMAAGAAEAAATNVVAVAVLEYELLSPAVFTARTR